MYILLLQLPQESSLSSTCQPNTGLAPMLLLPPAKATESLVHGEADPKLLEAVPAAELPRQP